MVDGSAVRVWAMYPRATFSKSLKKYILTFNFNRLAEARQEMTLSKSGIYIALSDAKGTDLRPGPRFERSPRRVALSPIHRFPILSFVICHLSLAKRCKR